MRTKSWLKELGREGAGLGTSDEICLEQVMSKGACDVQWETAGR